MESSSQSIRNSVRHSHKEAIYIFSNDLVIHGINQSPIRHSVTYSHKEPIYIFSNDLVWNQAVNQSPISQSRSKYDIQTRNQSIYSAMTFLSHYGINQSIKRQSSPQYDIQTIRNQFSINSSVVQSCRQSLINQSINWALCKTFKEGINVYI